MSNVILIAIVDKSVSCHLAEILKSAGYTSYFADKLSYAADVFSKFNPELIIADTEFSEWYLSQSKDEHLVALPPLLCYIKDYNARLAYDFLKKGAYDCINDPLRSAEIIEVVNNALSRDVLSFEKLARQTIFDHIRALPAQLKLFGGAGLFLFLLLFFIFLFKKGPTSRSFFTVPQQNITGIVVRPKTVFLSDWFTQAIYRYKRDTGEFIDVYYFSDYGPLGMASDGTALWTVGTDQKVRKYLLDDTARKLKQTAKILLPVSSPGGIFIDERNIWFSDIHHNKLYVYEIIEEQIQGSGVSLRAVAEYSTGNISPVGVLRADERVFIIDRISGSLFSGVISERKFIVQSEHIMKSAGQKIVALTAEGSHIFTVNKGDKTLVKKLPVGKLK